MLFHSVRLSDRVGATIIWEVMWLCNTYVSHCMQGRMSRCGVKHTNAAPLANSRTWAWIRAHVPLYHQQCNCCLMIFTTTNFPNLAIPHGGVIWHSQCYCEVSWLVWVSYPCTGWYTPGFHETLTLTCQNPYPWGGYGFSWVRVWVALEYPRVTHDNHYMAYLVCCSPTLTSGILMLIFMVANQGVADLYTHICTYPWDSIHEARGWIGWRLGRGLSIRPSHYDIHNFFRSDLISIPPLLSTFPLLHSLECQSWTLLLDLVFPWCAAYVPVLF